MQKCSPLIYSDVIGQRLTPPPPFLFFPPRNNLESVLVRDVLPQFIILALLNPCQVRGLFFYSSPAEHFKPTVLHIETPQALGDRSSVSFISACFIIKQLPLSWTHGLCFPRRNVDFSVCLHNLGACCLPLLCEPQLTSWLRVSGGRRWSYSTWFGAVVPPLHIAEYQRGMFTGATRSYRVLYVLDGVLPCYFLPNHYALQMQPHRMLWASVLKCLHTQSSLCHRKRSAAQIRFYH